MSYIKKPNEMEITYWEAIPEHTFGYKRFEVWDDSITKLNAFFKCTNCDTLNGGKVGYGSAGECAYCDRIDYWDLVSIEVDGEYIMYRSAIALLKKKKLIKYEKRKVIKSTEYKFKQLLTTKYV